MGSWSSPLTDCRVPSVSRQLCALRAPTCAVSLSLLCQRVQTLNVVMMNFHRMVLAAWLQESKEYFSMLTDFTRAVCDVRGGDQH